MLFLDPTTGWFAYCSCLLLILTYCFISPPFLLGNNFQSHIFKRGGRGGGAEKKKSACGELKSSCHRYLPGADLLYSLSYETL